MATKLRFDTTAADRSTASSRRVDGASTPTAAEVVRMPVEPELQEAARKSYSGASRIAILVGGALACWALVAGVASLIL